MNILQHTLSAHEAQKLADEANVTLRTFFRHLAGFGADRPNVHARILATLRRHHLLDPKRP